LKRLNPIPEFEPGFRFSFRDAIVLVVGFLSSFALINTYWPVSFIIAVALGHFFLFCNVFRISRRLEFIWSGIFITLSGATILTEFPGWLATMAISFSATIEVIAYEMKYPSYHGVGWEKINPKLKSWWDSNLAR